MASTQPTQLPLPKSARKFSSQWIDEATDYHEQALTAYTTGDTASAHTLLLLSISASAIATATEQRWAGYARRSAR
jgi:hypothetical protein